LELLKENKSESVLWLLQSIFSYLQESAEKYCDTKKFTRAYPLHGFLPEFKIFRYFTMFFLGMGKFTPETTQKDIRRFFTLNSKILRIIVEKYCAKNNFSLSQSFSTTHLWGVFRWNSREFAGLVVFFAFFTGDILRKNT